MKKPYFNWFRIVLIYSKNINFLLEKSNKIINIITNNKNKNNELCIAISQYSLLKYLQINNNKRMYVFNTQYTNDKCLKFSDFTYIK